MLLANSPKLRPAVSIFFVFALFLFGMSAERGHAATITVTANHDNFDPSDGECILREAILAALFDFPLDVCAAGDFGTDTINFDTAGVFATPQTITLTLGELVLSSPVTIEGPGANQLTITGNGSSRVFFVSNGSLATLDGLTMTGGNGIGFDSAFDGSGGGVYNDGGELTITNSTVSGNAAQFGGGIAATTLTITNSTVSGNSATIWGGGINTGSLTMTNSTVSGNSAAGSAGGLLSGDATIANSTIAGNRADSDGDGSDEIQNPPLGGGIWFLNPAGPVTLNSTIVAGNFLGTGTTPDDISVVNGSINNANHNLIGDAATSGGIANGVDGNIVGADPMLGALDFNGGPTRTHALLSGSPAVNAGANPLNLLNDQRGTGFDRVVNGTADIGAYESADAGNNTAPVAVDDSRSTNEDTPLSGSSVLGNDSDGEDDLLTAVLVSGPSNAQSFALNPDGTFSYTPNPNFFGEDSFTYKANDGALDSNVATVTITVNSVNDLPTVEVFQGGSCASKGEGGTMNLVVSDVESGAGSLSLGKSSSNTTLVPLANIAFGGSGANRTVSITAVQQKSTQSSVVTITVGDGDGGTSQVTVTVIVGSNDNVTINGTGAADMIIAGNGNDTVNAGAGNDLVCGGTGNDTVNGGDGDDTIEGANGNDILRGDAGNDTLRGGEGNDRLEGGNDNDALTGGLGGDRFLGGAGTDTATDFNAGQGDTTDGTIP